MGAEELLLHHEAEMRLLCFGGILGLMMWWEHNARLRPTSQPRIRRWVENLGMGVVDTLVLRLLLPVLAVGVALVSAEQGWGLLHYLAWPYAVELAWSLLILDLAIYLQHVAMHKVPLLWRLHRVHHSDLDLDTTTALRFHPLEIVLSMLFKMLLVVTFGIPAAAVIAFEVILNATALFNHGNVSLPAPLERLIRLFVVTPDMHRVHHSWYREETDSNFGFNLTLWDRLFHTYRAQPRDGHLGMTIGLHTLRERRWLSLHWLLLQPFLEADAD